MAYIAFVRSIARPDEGRTKCRRRSSSCWKIQCEVIQICNNNNSASQSHLLSISHLINLIWTSSQCKAPLNVIIQLWGASRSNTAHRRGQRGVHKGAASEQEICHVRSSLSKIYTRQILIRVVMFWGGFIVAFLHASYNSNYYVNIYHCAVIIFFHFIWKALFLSSMVSTL